MKMHFTKMLGVCCVLALSLTTQFSAFAQGNCQNATPFLTVSLAPTNSAGTVQTISTCYFTTEYAQLTNVLAGAQYSFNSFIGSPATQRYLTIRSGAVGGPVVAQGVAPVVYTPGSADNLFVHITVSAACNTEPGCNTLTVQNLSGAVPDCLGVLGGTANPGTPCNDGNPNTFNDTWSVTCTCVGTPGVGNEVCGGATNIGCGQTVTGSTVGASPDVAPFCGTSDGTGGGRWYRFASPITQLVTMNTCSPTTNFDTKLRVYSGTCGELVCVGGNDDMGLLLCPLSGLRSQVIFTAQAGTLYYVLVHGFSSLQGDYELSITCDPFDCPGLGNIGDACDDGNAGTFNDVVTAACVCEGTPYDCQNLNANIGDPCTVGGQPGSVTAACDCAPVVFAGCTNGFQFGTVATDCALPGGSVLGSWVNENSLITGVENGIEYTFSATDGPATIPFFYVTITDEANTILAFGVSPLTYTATNTGNLRFFTHGSPDCAGAITGSASSHTRAVSWDCSGLTVDCPGLGNIGDACSDGDPGTFDDVITASCDCVGTPYDCQGLNANIGDPCTVFGQPGTLNADCGCDPIVFAGCVSTIPWQSIVTDCDPLVDQFGLSTIAWTPEYTPVTVVNGVAYTFSVIDVVNPLDFPVAYVTISDADNNILAFGLNSVEWTSNYDGIARFHVHSQPDCGGVYSGLFEHTRRVDWDCNPTPVCQANGGTLVYTGTRSFCVATGAAQGANISVTGAVGTNQRWALVRSSDGEIIATRAGNSQFNLDIYPAGDYYIRYIRFENDVNLAGITNVSQVNSLTGCFGISSNQINLFLRPTPNGGTLTNLSPTTVCADGGVATSIQVGLSGFVGENRRYAVVSQSLGNQVVLQSAGSPTGATFNLNGLPAGTYRVFALAFQQGVSLIGVEFQSQLAGCFSLSTPVVVNIVNCLNAELTSNPNPTAGPSFVTFTNPREEYATLEVYDMSGRMVSRLFNEVTQPDQEYRLEFNGSSLPNGVYIYRLTTDSEVIVNKFMIAR